MTKHVNDLIQKSIDVPKEKLIIEYVIENKKLKKRIEELEKENERLKGDLELRESGGCRAINLFECDVVKELKEQIEKMKSDVIKHFGEEYNILVVKLLKEWEKEAEREDCPNIFCEDCTKEDCTVRKLGLVPIKEM